MNISKNGDFEPLSNWYIKVGQNKICMPDTFQEYFETFKNFEVRDDDVFVLGFPKTGCRWTQELVWLLLNDLDYDSARKTLLYNRAPFLELSAVLKQDEIFRNYYFQFIDDSKSPRCIMSHLHWCMLPKDITAGNKNPKMIVVLRGIEDTCTSYFYHLQAMWAYNGNFDEFCKLFLEGKVNYGPYWNYVLEMWEQRERPNIMFLRYSKMLEDFEATVRSVATFLGRNLSNYQIQTLVEYLKFDNLKNCAGFNMEHLKLPFNPFIRSGKVDGYKNVMSLDVIEKFKRQKNEKLKNTNLTLE
ncbi:hypothetical protein FQA39_LY06524 [Lamprigera yunnana]|nr:hypothetical protein FQA39_LY06524 [Lamprigera yunnana]